MLIVRYEAHLYQVFVWENLRQNTYDPSQRKWMIQRNILDLNDSIDMSMPYDYLWDICVSKDKSESFM